MSLAEAWDDEFIDECLQQGQVPKLVGIRPLGNCRWCTHIQHGLPCPTTDCGCDCAFNSRDDSWRPPDFAWSTPIMKARRFADLHGVDGWIAKLVTGESLSTISGQRARYVRSLLEGTSPTTAGSPT